MGRGRQKAKHTKVARELKYFSPNTDLNALEKELGHRDDQSGEPEYIDKWADLYGDEDGDDPAGEGESADSDSGSDAGSDAGSDGGGASAD